MTQISLFSNNDLRRMKDKRQDRIEERINSLSFEQLNEEEIVQELKEDLLFDKIKLEDYNRREGTETKQGKNLVIEIPYRGKQDILESRPSTYSHNPPRCQQLSSSHIVLHIEVTPSSDAEEIEDKIQERIKEIEKCAKNANEDIGDFNSELESDIERKIQSRLEKLEETEDTMDQLLD